MAPRRVRIHVTAFGAFPGCADNPTAQVAARLEAQGGLASVEVLEVDARACQRRVEEAVRAAVCSEPDAAHLWVHLGVATEMRDKAIVLETTAANEATFRRPDISGWQPTDARVDAAFGGHHALRTALELERVARAMCAAGLPAVTGADAGRYVCNFTYYASLMACRRCVDNESYALFIHIPPEDVLSVDESAARVRAALALCAAEVEGLVSACGRFAPLRGPGSPSALVVNVARSPHGLHSAP